MNFWSYPKDIETKAVTFSDRDLGRRVGKGTHKAYPCILTVLRV